MFLSRTKFLFISFFFGLGLFFATDVLNIKTDFKKINPLASSQSLGYKRLVNKYNAEIKECEKDRNKEISCINDILKNIASKYGARFALDVIEPLASDSPLVLSQSHDFAHTVGDYAIRYFDVSTAHASSGEDGFSEEELTLINKIGKTLVDCDGWGAFGCYHGVIEIGLSRLPTEKRTTVVRKACLENPLIQSKQYYVNQCLHWFGHGMAIFTDQTLLETLDVCDKLNETFSSDEVQLCLSGVFHAGSVPGNVDVDYLDNIYRVYGPEDVYYPCRTLPEKFKGQCFSHVPGRTKGLPNANGPDLERIFRNCDGIPEIDPAKKLNYIHRCYDSGANTLLVNANFEASRTVEDCRTYSNPKYSKYCYAGAVRYWILRDPLLNNQGPFEICSLAEKENKETCYRALGAANYENYFDQSVLEKYCKSAEEGYYNYCLAKDIPD